jgi:hypothetical protein
MMKSIIIGMMICERKIYAVLYTGIATAVAMRRIGEKRGCRW